MGFKFNGPGTAIILIGVSAIANGIASIFMGVVGVYIKYNPAKVIAVSDNPDGYWFGIVEWFLIGVVLVSWGISICRKK
jgi:hypothetical protein